MQRCRFGCVGWGIVLNRQRIIMVGGIRGVGSLGIEYVGFKCPDLQGSAYLVRFSGLGGVDSMGGGIRGG